MRRNDAAPPPERRPGRPPKFGRPARLVAVTLPTDVVSWLRDIDPDVGRAIVSLHDAARHTMTQAPRQPPAAAELVDVGEGRALIVVDPALVRGVEGIAAVPFGSGRAFLALRPGGTLADLELAVLDALDRGDAGPKQRDALASFRDLLRTWRTSEDLAMEPKSIIVARRRAARRRRQR